VPGGVSVDRSLCKLPRSAGTAIISAMLIAEAHSTASWQSGPAARLSRGGEPIESK